MTSEDYKDSLSILMSIGVVFHLSQGKVSFSAPPGITPSQALKKANVTEEELSLALVERYRHETLTSPIIASGFLTPGQERLLLSSSVLPDQQMTLRPTTILIEGSLDTYRLERALSYTIARFAALRALIRLRIDGTFVQCITVADRFILPVIDLISEKDTEKALRNEIRKITSKPLSILQNFFRFHVFKLAREQWCLSVSISHMISDVWSLGLFYKTLASAYENNLTWNDVKTKKHFEQDYFDITKQLRNHRYSKAGERSRAYWCEELSQPHIPLLINGAKSVPGTIGFKLSEHKFLINLSEVYKYEDFANQHNTNLSGLLFAAWALTLRSCSGVNELRVGMMAACRTTIKLEREMGFFSNPIVINIDFTTCQSSWDVLKLAIKKIRAGIEHQETPIQDILTELAKNNKSFIPSNLFQTMFVFNNVPDISLHLPGLVCQEIDPLVEEFRNEATTIDIRLSLTPSDKGLICIIVYKTDKFDRAIIENMQHIFLKCLFMFLEKRDAFNTY